MLFIIKLLFESLLLARCKSTCKYCIPFTFELTT
nr:MAG TPA: ShK-like peptide [Caudoviricetes sp.]